MANTYKVWIHIEEIDEEKDHYEDLPEELRSIGKFDTLKDARSLVSQVVENIQTDGEGNIVL